MRLRHFRLAILPAVLLLAIPSGVRASAKELPRDKELSGKEASKIPERGLAGDVTRKKSEKAKESPALKYDDYALGVELQVASKRREQIETLQKIIQLGPAEGEAPNLIFRLAELYWEESKFFFFESNRKDDDIIRAKAEKNETAEKQAEAEKRAALKRSEGYQSLAMEQYRIIVRKYPKYERIDEVLFFLGHNMWDSGKEKDAITVYKKLIEDHSKSKYLPDAWVAIGQYYFNNSQGKPKLLEQGLEAFKKAATYTESKVYGYALYMQGWCQFNLGDHKAAMDMFKAVIYLGELQGKGDTRSTALSKEARKDYVVAFSRIGDALSAKSDFQKVGGDEHWWTMLKGLANLYYEDGKDKEAASIYKLMIKERPLSPEAPFFQGRIVDCVMRVGNKKITVGQVRDLVRIIKDVEKAGVVTKEEDKKAFGEAKDLAERTMSHLAVSWHNEAKKTRDESTFFLAAEVYQDYLEVFAESPKAYDLRFFYAELLNDNLGKYDRAAEEYTKVVLEDIRKIDPPKAPDGTQPPAEQPGRWLINASYNSILAFDEVAKRFEKDEQLPASDGRTKLPIPPPKMNLLAACERYIRFVPQGEKRVDVMYKAATIYYRYNYFEKAVDLFGAIALERPDSELAEYAANLVLDSFNLQGDWVKMNEWARKFFAQPKLAKGKFRDELARVLEQSSFKLVNISEEKGEFAAAGEAYLGFVSEFPHSNLADQALFNASVDFFKGKQIDRSLEVSKQLVARYPNSALVPRSIYANGQTYETIGDFEQSAEAYEAYAMAFADSRKGKVDKKPRGRRGAGKAASPTAKEAPSLYEESKAQVALNNAGVFREALSQYKEALRDRQMYVDLWPDSKDTEAVFLSMASLLEKSGQTGKALNHLEEYEKLYGRDSDKMLSAELRILRIYEKAGGGKNVQRILGRILDFYEKMSKAQRAKMGPEATEAVARAAYAALESDYESFARISFPADPKKMQALVETKKKAMVELRKRYSDIVNMKVAEPAICSLEKIGMLFKNFADRLAETPTPEMPIPAQLNPIKHLLGKPWAKWPKEYREAIPEADFESLKAQLAQAQQDFESEYRRQLFEGIAPAEESAAEAFATAVDTARSLAIYNECSQQAYELLSAKYRPVKYPKVTERLAELNATAESREGNGLLSKVQPVPEPPKGGAAAVGSPDLTKVSGPGTAPAASGTTARPEPTKGGAEPAGAAGPAEPAEPDDPDLIQ